MYLFQDSCHTTFVPTSSLKGLLPNTDAVLGQMTYYMITNQTTEIDPRRPVQRDDDLDLPYRDYADVLSFQDRRCLKGLSPLQTRTWTLSRIEQYRARILALGSIHNLATPLHARLPTEILIQIFGHIRPTSRKEIALAHVCRLWRSVLVQTSVFWAKMLETKIGGSLSTEGAASDSVLR